MNLANAEAIFGWMSSAELAWLAETASKCQSIVEIGSYFGRSTVAMLDNSKATVYCIDPMDGKYFDNDNKPLDFIDAKAIEQFKANTARFGDRCQLIRRYSTDVKLAFELPRVDFTFIDGDHRYDTVMLDIELAKYITKAGGIIAGHDYADLNWPGVQAAVDVNYLNVGRVGSIWFVENV